jgi:hypothetical protein
MTLIELCPACGALPCDQTENPSVFLETQAAEIARLRGLLGEAEGALVEAIIGVGDDYMTSEAHHPDYVLIPVAKFDQLVAAEEALKRGDIRAETGGGEDERP